MACVKGFGSVRTCTGRHRSGPDRDSACMGRSFAPALVSASFDGVLTGNGVILTRFLRPVCYKSRCRFRMEGEMDILYISVTVFFFLISAGLVALLKNL